MDKFHAKDYSWVPIGRSIHMEKKGNESDQDLNAKIENLAEKVDGIETSITALVEKSSDKKKDEPTSVANSAIFDNM